MKKQYLYSTLFLLPLLLMTSCKAQDGYISLEEEKEYYKSAVDKQYSSYTLDGTMNFFGLDNVPTTLNYTTIIEKTENNNTYSNVLKAPIHIHYESEEQFAKDRAYIKNIFIPSSGSLDDVYVYKNSYGGIDYKIFNTNTRMIVDIYDSSYEYEGQYLAEKLFEFESSGKWNATLSYDADGYLVKQEFETINARKEAPSESIYCSTLLSYSA